MEWSLEEYNMGLPKEWLEFLRQQFPQGSRIRLRELRESPTHAADLPLGTLERIDDEGVFHMSWVDGSSLGLVLGEDRFQVIPPEPVMLKLYMPLTVKAHERNFYGDRKDTLVNLDDREILKHEDAILHAFAGKPRPEDPERGLMRYYREDDGVNQKVLSCMFTVERVHGQLMGAALCRIQGALTDEELDLLKDYIGAQSSDFEQKEIQHDNGRIDASFSNSNTGWFIRTEQELYGPKLAEGLPELCFTLLPGMGKLICIKRGERGYYPSDWETGDPVKNRELADYNNLRLGVTKAQEEAMRTGSMCGWDCPGADPRSYEQDTGAMKMGGMNLE